MLDEDIADSSALLRRDDVEDRVEEFRVVDQVSGGASERERSEHFFDHVETFGFHRWHDCIGYDIKRGVENGARLLFVVDHGQSRHARLTEM